MTQADKAYLKIARQILEEGEVKGDRTGAGTKSIFGTMTRYDLSKEFPILTCKEVHFKSVVHELLWMISGDTNIRYLEDNKVRIWHDDAYKYYRRLLIEAGYDKDILTQAEWLSRVKSSPRMKHTSLNYTYGDLGPIYGKQWRSWQGKDKDGKGQVYIDQLQSAKDTIKNNPESRRIIVNAWNVGEISQMGLPPCHAFFQFNCTPIPSEAKSQEQLSKGGRPLNGPQPAYFLDCQVHIRSNDWGLGFPYNQCFYAMLTHLVAQVTNTVARHLIITTGDTHIYLNQITPPEGYDSITRLFENETFKAPVFKLNPEVKNIDDFRFSDFELIDYRSAGKVKLILNT